MTAWRFVNYQTNLPFGGWISLRYTEDFTEAQVKEYRSLDVFVPAKDLIEEIGAKSVGLVDVEVQIEDDGDAHLLLEGWRPATQEEIVAYHVSVEAKAKGQQEKERADYLRLKAKFEQEDTAFEE